jgi:casein kinase II subunit beta
MMECDSSSSTGNFIDIFLNTKGNEVFCQVEEEYIVDRFNLTGLQTMVAWYGHALDVILDKVNLNRLEDAAREKLLESARHLYGLIHARYIVTTQGMEKMSKKYTDGVFGTCPRVLCEQTRVLPIGTTDNPGVASIHFYCPRCQDIYNPRSSRHAQLDGAYWGTTFPHLMLLMHPSLVPGSNQAQDKFIPSVDAYVPKIFGFRIHSHAKLLRARKSLRDGEDPSKLGNQVEPNAATA